MNIDVKQKIAAIERNLILQLEYCDDEEFVDLILQCVNEANPFPIYPEYL